MTNFDSLGTFTLSVALGAATGGAIAGALIGGVSYLVSSGISGADITVSGFLSSVGIGALNGAIGGLAGTVTEGLKTALSISAGIIAGVYTAINIDGSLGQKISTGVDVGFIAATSTYIGASIDTSGLSPAATAFANYGTTLFVGTPAELISVVTQQTNVERNLKGSFSRETEKEVRNPRNRPRNYVACFV